MINNIYDIYIYDNLYIWYFSNIKNLNYIRIRHSQQMLYKLISDNENAILLGHHSFIKYVFNKKNYEWDDKMQKLLFNIFILVYFNIFILIYLF